MFFHKKSQKRKFERTSLQTHETVRVDINGKNFIDILKAKNISVGGVGILVPYLFEGCEINEKVSLIVQLPKPFDYSISTPGEITHVTGKVFGGIFLSLNEEDQKILNEFLEYHSKKLNLNQSS